MMTNGDLSGNFFYPILTQIMDSFFLAHHSILNSYLRNEFTFWNVKGIMNTSGLLQSKWSPKGFTLALQETQSIHDSMNIPKSELQNGKSEQPA